MNQNHAALALLLSGSKHMLVAARPLHLSSFTCYLRAHVPEHLASRRSLRVVPEVSLKLDDKVQGPPVVFPPAQLDNLGSYNE